MDLLRRTFLQSAVAIGTPPLILARRAQAETFP
jgi:hypothetical protein